MTTWADILVAGLWRAGWAVVPVALVVAAVCRYGKCNATTRHALWLTTLAGLIAAMWMPGPTVEPPPAPEPVYFVGSQYSGFASQFNGSDAGPPTFVPVVGGGRARQRTYEKDDKATTAQVAASVEPTPPRTAACSADSSAAWLASTANRLRRLSIPFLEQFEWGREWVCDFSSECCCFAGTDEFCKKCDAVARACNTPVGDCSENCCHGIESRAGASPSDWLAAISGMIAGGWTKARGEMTDALAASTMSKPATPARAESSPQDNIASALSALSSLGPVRTTSNPDELDPWPGEPGAEFSARAEWQRFMSGLLGVRDALGLVPPLPTTAWVVGFVAVSGLLSFRAISAARRLRRAHPADAETLRLVEREARRLGLKSPPETLLIDDRVSPLIWCGKRVQLILPESFWSELDYDARRAVICHELAHIRRRDHWVRRLEILITCLYWWHPVMWWVRARMAEEADACCDEWVTWVLPRERRAYARALLAATDFVSGSTAPQPLAVAMASARASKIARRLTMIMTATRRPGLGLTGICGIFVLAALAWVATPAQSCPPEEETTQTRSRQPAPPAIQTVKARNTGETGDGVEEAGEFDDADISARLRKIEAELSELSKQLGRKSDTPHAPHAHGHLVPAQPFAAMTPLPSMPRALAPMIAQPTPFAPMAQGGAYSNMIAGPRPGFEQPFVSRTYKLSGDRLEALTEIMVRDDVPVLVTPTEEGIEVHGTEAQQAVFAAFIKMITANEKAAEVKLPDEKLEAVKKLAALDSVPTRFHIGDDSISVQGTPAEQAIFDAFIALIHPKNDGQTRMRTPGIPAMSPVSPMAPVSPFAPATPATPSPDAHKHKPGKPAKAPKPPKAQKAKPGEPALAPGSAAAGAEANLAASALELDRAKLELEAQLSVNKDALKNDLALGGVRESLLKLERSAALLAELTVKERELAATKRSKHADLNSRRGALQAQLVDLNAEREQLEGQADHLEAEADTVEAKADSAGDSKDAEGLKQVARQMRTEAQKSRRSANRLEKQIDKLEDAIAEMETEEAGTGR